VKWRDLVWVEVAVGKAVYLVVGVADIALVRRHPGHDKENDEENVEK
jgi:hypothetical protein